MFGFQPGSHTKVRNDPRSLIAGAGITITYASAKTRATIAVDQAYAFTWTADHTWSGGKIVLMAGTTAKAPLNFTSGTNLTTPVAGAMEYDGTVHYATHAANERGAINAEQWICNTAAYTLTSQTAAQKMFNSPTNGAVTVAGSTTYQFECELNLTALSSATDFGFAIGGTATLTSVKFWSVAAPAALGTATTARMLMNATSASLALEGAPSGTAGSAFIRGILRVNAGGTIIPQVSLATAAAAIVGINSMFRLWPVGTNTQVSLGNWS